MSTKSIPFIPESEIIGALTWDEAVDAIETALQRGDAPGNTPLRTQIDVNSGQLLIMPAEVGLDVGVKVVSVGTDNPKRGLPRIQGVHLVFSGDSLSPVMVLDAAGLTSIRTAAVSALAMRLLAAPDAGRMVLYGTGPQAWSHVQAFSAVRPLTDVAVIGRRTEGVLEFVLRCQRAGLAARAGSSADVARADIVACCTTSHTPLFDSSLLADHAAVIAVGSHVRHAREVDTALIRRATVVVESRRTAIQEAVDVLLAIADGVPPDEAIDGDLGELVRRELTMNGNRPKLFKSVGEAWGDVVIASAVVARLGVLQSV